jgi:hypothetical protein
VTEQPWVWVERTKTPRNEHTVASFFPSRIPCDIHRLSESRRRENQPETRARECHLLRGAFSSAALNAALMAEREVVPFIAPKMVPPVDLG